MKGAGCSPKILNLTPWSPKLKKIDLGVAEIYLTLFENLNKKTSMQAPRLLAVHFSLVSPSK